MDDSKQKPNMAKNKSNTSLRGLEDFFKQQIDLVKAEVNFLRWPYFIPDSHASSSARSIRVTETIPVDNKETQRVWEVIPHPELGLPGLFEYKVFLALKKLAEEHIKEYNEVPECLYIPSLYLICKLIGLDTIGGWDKRRIKESIARMGRTQCYSMGAFYNKATKEYMDSNKSFTLITDWGFKGDIQNGKLLEQSYVIFHEAVRQNLQANYVKALDFDFIKELKTDIGPLLYPHLSAIFHDFRSDQEYWEITYAWIAERLGIRIYSELWRAKQQLKAAHGELQKSGYLAKIDWITQGKKVRYYPGLRARYEHERQTYRKNLANKASHKSKQGKSVFSIPAEEIVSPEDNQISFLCFKFSTDRPISQEELAKANLTNIEDLKTAAISRGFPVK